MEVLNMTKIRQANEADIPAIQQIATESWHHTYQDLMPLKIINQCVETFYQEDVLIKRIADRCVLVASEDQVIKGFLDASENLQDAHLYALYIKPGATRQGIGSRLFYDYINREHPQSLTVDVEKGNEKAGRFYQKHNFKYEATFVDEVFNYPLQTERYILMFRVSGD